MEPKETKQLIICPECSTTQEAIVVHTFPFLTFIHHCVKCKYVIMESEWNQIEESKTKNHEETNRIFRPRIYLCRNSHS